MTRPPARPLGDLVAASRLLDRELPARRFVDDRYLRSLYGANPLGDAYVADAYEAGRLDGHYALVPQRYRNRHGPRPMVFSLNAVTRSGAQRKGTFTRLGRLVWGAAADDGVAAVIGVTNDRSITPVVRAGWRHICRLPVLVCPPVAPPVGWSSVAVDDTFLGSDGPSQWFADLDEAPAEEWMSSWDPDVVRWRLSLPGLGPYAVHRDAATTAVSTATRVGGVEVAVVLKLWSRRGHDAPRSAQRAVAAACRHHRAPVAVYAGFNRLRSLRGWPLPDRLRPAPLNLMVYCLDPALDQDRFTLDTFEFLDMDAF